jgi:hypothetical protein
VLCLCLLGKSGFDGRLECTGDEMLIGIGQLDLIAFTAAITTNFILKFGEFNSKAHPRAANAKGGRNDSEELTWDYPSFPNHSLLGLDARLGRIPHPLFANLTAGEQEGGSPSPAFSSVSLDYTRFLSSFL